MKFFAGLGLLSSLLLVSNASAAIVFSEPGSGELSNARLMPTLINLSGIDSANTIIGQVGNNGQTGATNGTDADYFRVTIGAGQTLDSITVDNYLVTPGGGTTRSFIGYREGINFLGVGMGDIDASALFNGASGDLLPTFTGGPVGPGDYSFWVQETANVTVDYQLTLNVTTAVPEPSSMALLAGVGIIGVFRIRKQRKRSSQTS